VGAFLVSFEKLKMDGSHEQHLVPGFCDPFNNSLPTPLLTCPFLAEEFGLLDYGFGCLPLLGLARCGISRSDPESCEPRDPEAPTVSDITVSHQGLVWQILELPRF